MNKPVYVLGHSDRELSRLAAQAQLLEPVTRHILLDAGIRAGMRVLDIGSGAGDVAFLAAELVGRSGEVIGTDTAAAAVTAAMRSARERGLPHVSFREGDPSEMQFDRSFDAVIGRYVLLFQADPIEMVRKLAGHVRTGGLVVFHEPDWLAARSCPPAPIYDRCCGWINETFRRSGTDSNMAAGLYTIFVRAGLTAPSMRMQTFIGRRRGVCEFPPSGCGSHWKTGSYDGTARYCDGRGGRDRDAYRATASRSGDQCQRDNRTLGNRSLVSHANVTV